VLQPERTATYAYKVKKGDRGYRAVDRGPDFQWKTKHSDIEKKRERVREKHNRNNKLPVRIPYTEAHYRQIDL
jgi:hypothetical protein